MQKIGAPKIFGENFVGPQEKSRKMIHSPEKNLEFGQTQTFCLAFLELFGLAKNRSNLPPDGCGFISQDFHVSEAALVPGVLERMRSLDSKNCGRVTQNGPAKGQQKSLKTSVKHLATNMHRKHQNHQTQNSMK